MKKTLEKDLLEMVYREEYVRSKARKDYEQCLASKSAPKKQKEKYYKALGHIIWGGAAMFLLYQIYMVFCS
ncbi:MAG: hypothetical protein GXW85_05980 [Clostridia bacterium]|nr:hypothetical protein [Clostridia bacterium]